MGTVVGGNYQSTYTGDQIDALLGNVATANTNGGITALNNLAPQETDTTASRAYNPGEYFCLNGFLCYTTVAIAAGDTFSSANRTVISVAAKLPHPFSLPKGSTLTITTPYAGVYAILVSTASASTTLNSLTFLSGYSNASSNLKEITPLKTGSDIAVAKTATTFTITNNHASYGLQGSIFILCDNVNGLSWSIS